SNCFFDLRLFIPKILLSVLAPVSRSYPPLEGRLVTCYSPGHHFTHGLLHFLVRLACVRHAASVDSEPGSNSRLKPVRNISRRRCLGPFLTGSRGRALHRPNSGPTLSDLARGMPDST